MTRYSPVGTRRIWYLPSLSIFSSRLKPVSTPLMVMVSPAAASPLMLPELDCALTVAGSAAARTALAIAILRVGCSGGDQGSWDEPAKLPEHAVPDK